MSSIRLAGPADRGAVEEIVQSAYARYISLIGQKPGPMLDDYAALIEGRHVHVLSDEHGLAGILVLIPNERTMLLDNVAVHPRAQGRGYGRALMAHAEKIAGGMGLKTIRLYTNEAMTENIALYERLGFVETHRAEEKGFRRVYMAKSLDTPP